MSVITAFLNQRCTWYKKIGADPFGKPILDVGVPDVRCRWVLSIKAVETEAGKIHPGTVSVLVEADVNAADVLSYQGSDKAVLAIDEIRGIDGELIGKWCYC